jgi:hypothetical protein
MFIKYNANQAKNRVGDCVIRAISTVMDMEWEDVYMEIALQGLSMYDMPSSNSVWSAYLLNNGFHRQALPDTCPDCYSVRDFCMDHRQGRYVLATGSHAIAAISGNYIDTWDSGDEVPVYFFMKEGK